MSLYEKYVKGKNINSPAIDLESIFFIQLLMISQQCQIEFEPLFSYELRAVSPSLIDEHRYIRHSQSICL